MGGERPTRRAMIASTTIGSSSANGRRRRRRRAIRRDLQKHDREQPARPSGPRPVPLILGGILRGPGAFVAHVRKDQANYTRKGMAGEGVTFAERGVRALPR